MAYSPYPYQQYPYQQYPITQPQQQQQVQNNGFVSARTIEEAYNWPIAPGNSITFKIENTPYVCTKTKGFSPLEQPVFERYRLVKEEDADKKDVESKSTKYDEQFEKLWNEINSIKSKMGGRKRDKSADVDASEAVSE